MSEVLRLEGLTIQIAGLRAVDQLSFSVEAGQIVSLIGPNGAGKTTTFNAISGYMRPAAGRVVLFGEDVTGLSPDRMRPGSQGFRRLGFASGSDARPRAIHGALESPASPGMRSVAVSLRSYNARHAGFEPIVPHQ